MLVGSASTGFFEGDVCISGIHSLHLFLTDNIHSVLEYGYPIDGVWRTPREYHILHTNLNTHICGSFQQACYKLYSL